MTDADKIDLARIALVECYTFLVGYNPRTGEGSSLPESRAYCVAQCLQALTVLGWPPVYAHRHAGVVALTTEQEAEERLRKMQEARRG